MSQTPEQLKSNGLAMIAASEEKPVQSRLIGACDFHLCTTPTWRFSELEYRPAPVLVTRALDRPEDIPLGCWLKSGDSRRMILVVGFTSGGWVMTGDGCVHQWSELQHWQYSTDRITWHPCTKEVEG